MPCIHMVTSVGMPSSDASLTGGLLLFFCFFLIFCGEDVNSNKKRKDKKK